MTLPRYATLSVPGVVVYENPFVYLAENPDREAANGVTGDLGGWDVADGFRLAETQVAGAPDSEWRISVLDHEVYAVLRRFPGAREYTFDGPVWLVARIPPALAGALLPSDAVQELMFQVEQIRREPDSLLAAITMIQTGLRALEQA